MKNLLVLTDPIGKPSYAPRLRFFCDYLTREGYHVEVWTEAMESYSFAHDYPINELPTYRNGIDWVIKSFWSLLTDWRNRHFSKKLQQQLVNRTFDAVLCTTFSTFPLRAALDVAQVKHIPLIVDIRDLDEQVPDAQYQSHRSWWARPFRNWYKRVNIRRRNAVLRQADCITTVSPWHVDFIRQFNSNVHLIYNGFDPRQFFYEAVPNPQFLISYIGRIYEFQHKDLIEQAVRELNIQDIVLNWHTPEYRSIPITEVGDEIRRSSIMLVLTSAQTHGMMTTKFFEALGCEKPILCIPSDKGCLAQAMVETNAGLASDNIEEIKQFILDKYNEWKANGYTHQVINNKDSFSRLTQAKQMESLLLQTCESRVLLTDICWTLYSSNTTFDFLDATIHDKSYLCLRRWMKCPIVRWCNMLCLKLFHYDYLRQRAISYLRSYNQVEIDQMAEVFVNTHLEQHKIEEAWQVLKGRQVVIFSGTITPIAQAVAKRIGAQQVYAGDIYKRAMHLKNYDILTDNRSDLPFIQQAHSATIVTYNNQSWWERQKYLPPCTFISGYDTRY